MCGKKKSSLSGIKNISRQYSCLDIYSEHLHTMSNLTKDAHQPFQQI
jgi:hypothetical protein